VSDPDFMALGPTALLFAGVDVRRAYRPPSSRGSGPTLPTPWDAATWRGSSTASGSPLTPGSFVRHLRDSVRFDRLRVPADAEEARRQLCG
jgi:hypothetical protein